MSDPYLSISSSSGTIALNSIASAGTGAEAQPGATGLGLPPIEASFSNGAGDGSFYVGRRVLSRTPEFEVAVMGTSRADLKNQMRTLSRIITAEDVVLHWIEPGVSEHVIKAHLIGGGDYVYGSDTIGNLTAKTTLRFQSEEPYWSNVDSNSTTVTIDSLTEVIPTVNDGSVNSVPVVRVHGPLDGWFSVMTGGTGYRFDAKVGGGQVIEIDHSSGGVRDLASGVSLYEHLGSLPRFFEIPPGPSNIEFKMGGFAPEEVARTNHVINPELGTSTTGWAIPAGTTRMLHANPAFGYGLYMDTRATTGSAAREVVAFVTGLVPGRIYAASVRHATELLTGTGGLLSVRDGVATVASIALHPSDWDDETQSVTTFMAPASGAVTLVARAPSYYSGGTWRVPTWLGQFYVGEPGAYFSGATPDTAAVRHDWTGTAHASKSTLTTLPADPVIEISYQEREWLVI